jgi:predicted N-acetyltransferase YhbS
MSFTIRPERTEDVADIDGVLRAAFAQAAEANLAGAIGLSSKSEQPVTRATEAV